MLHAFVCVCVCGHKVREDFLQEVDQPYRRERRSTLLDWGEGGPEEAPGMSRGISTFGRENAAHTSWVLCLYMSFLHGRAGLSVQLKSELVVLSFIQQNELSFAFLGPHPQHMEVPRLGVKWEL